MLTLIEIEVMFITSIQGAHLNCIFKFPVFPVTSQIFPMSIYQICDYYIQKTDLADISSF